MTNHRATLLLIVLLSIGSIAEPVAAQRHSRAVVELDSIAAEMDGVLEELYGRLPEVMNDTTAHADQECRMNCAFLAVTGAATAVGIAAEYHARVVRLWDELGHPRGNCDALSAIEASQAVAELASVDVGPFTEWSVDWIAALADRVWDAAIALDVRSGMLLVTTIGVDEPSESCGSRL